MGQFRGWRHRLISSPEGVSPAAPSSTETATVTPRCTVALLPRSPRHPACHPAFQPAASPLSCPSSHPLPASLVRVKNPLTRIRKLVAEKQKSEAERQKGRENRIIVKLNYDALQFPNRANLRGTHLGVSRSLKKFREV